ncbi:MAG: tetratricopeptide repeat protein [Cyanobacteria bacterium J06649_4]
MRCSVLAGLSLVVFTQFSAAARAQNAYQQSTYQPDTYQASTYQLFQQGTLAGAFEERRAESIWRELIRRAPQSSVGYYYLGLSLANQGRFVAAEASYREAIRLNPHNAIAHYNLATTLQAQNQTSAANTAMRTAVSLYKNDAAAHCDFASALQDQFDFEGAIAASRNAVLTDTDYAFADGVGMGSVCSMHRFSHTAGLLQSATQLYPNDAEWQYRLGAVLDREERWEEAKIAYESAIRINPTYGAAYRRLSATLRRLGSDVAAREAYQTAVRLDAQIIQ